MKIYIIVGENKKLSNISARAAYSTREAAELYNNWFDDRITIVELDLDAEAGPVEAR
jgi:hypothetical protein